MKIYHVETQQNYDALMSELEEKGCKWMGGDKLTDFDEFSTHGIDTYVYEECCEIFISSGNYFKAHHSDETLTEYKAKGEDMTQEEMKRYFLNESRDISIAIENFVVDDSTTENPLSKAKSSAKKLLEKIDEYLESQKPKFKVGDYVTVDVNGRKIITKIDKLWEHTAEAHGLWYDQTKVNVKQDFWFVSKVSKCRYATPEEIAEYEVALTFHKHGRKPFEVERGDIVYLKGYDKNIFLDSGNIYKKHNFIDGDFGLVKTAEEVNEWL